MDFKQLEAFVAVVDWNSFSEAAKKLYLTQPTISAHVNSLENELHTTLIVRTTKSLSVTKDGYKLYDYAVNLIKLRKKACEEFEGESDNRIHLGVSTIPSEYIIPDVISEYNRLHPESVFVISQSDSAGIIDKVIDGRIDVGIVGIGAGERQLEFRPFVKDRIVVATPNNEHFRQLKRDRANLAVLIKEPIIMRERGSGTKKEADILLEKLRITAADLNIVAYMNDLETIKKCIINEMGISLMSAVSVKENAARGDMLVFDAEEYTQERYFYIVTRKDKILSSQTENFMNHLNKWKRRWNNQ